MNFSTDTQYYYVYVLQSITNGMWYTGFTVDLRRRIREHNTNAAGWTKNKGPFNLLYYEASRNIEDARSREKYLKSGMGKRYIRNRLKNFFTKTNFVVSHTDVHKKVINESKLHFNKY